MIASQGKLSNNLVRSNLNHGISVMKNSQLSLNDNVVEKNMGVGVICKDKSEIHMTENSLLENKIALLIESRSSSNPKIQQQNFILGETRVFKSGNCRIF